MANQRKAGKVTLQAWLPGGKKKAFLKEAKRRGLKHASDLLLQLIDEAIRKDC
jgi:hypothetical protein